MKTFNQLSDERQAKAVEKCLTNLLEGIVLGEIRFNDKLNHDDLQARIDKACARAENMQTPWFAHEYILKTCREDLEAIARGTAEGALYPDPGEQVITGV